VAAEPVSGATPVSTLPAHLIALPVLERLTGERSGVVLGAGASACWVDLDGFVVAVTTREVPLLPNAVALAAGSGTLRRPGLPAGSAARFAPGRIDLGPLRVTWDPTAPPAWDPTVPEATGAAPEALARRGVALLAALATAGAPGRDTLGADPDPAVGRSKDLNRGPNAGLSEDPNAGLSEDPNAESGAVDNRGPPNRGSATLPLRGPQHRRVRLEGARVRGVGLEGAQFQQPQQPAGSKGVQPQEPQQRRVEGPDLPARAEVAGPAALVRELVGELARIGLPTAIDPDGAAALARLFRAVGERDPGPAAGAARALLGRGPGLTPEGDDLLAAVAGGLAVLGPAGGWDRSVLDGFLAALVGPAAERTTALSVTLLELAARGRLVEPAGRLLDLGPGGEAGWPAALARLQRLGHGSGRAYAAGIAATARLLAAGSPVG
jgi:Protein of unknown function (DUF2877)